MAEQSVGIPGIQFTTAPDLHSRRRGALLRRLNWSKVLSLASLAVLLVAFFYLELRLPLSTATKIGQDEDYELSKATLVNHGYNLYSEIWNDQPPLITVMIAKLTKWWPQSILAPRLMTVCFSALLLGFTYLFIRSVNGSLAAAIGSLF